MPKQSADRIKERAQQIEPRPTSESGQGYVLLEPGTRNSHSNTADSMDIAHLLGWMERNRKMRRGHGKTLRQRLQELTG